jgi:hypothetical protein
VRYALPLLTLMTLWLVLSLAHAALTAPKPIELAVSPRIGFAPATLAIRVRVHPGQQDRWITVMTDGENYSRLSEWTIEPDRTLYSFMWPNVGPGEYDVLARIGHGDVVSGSDRISVQIQGGP